MTFQVDKAREEGYDDPEILKFLHEKNPSFDLEGAKKEGYDDGEIIKFLSSYNNPSPQQPVTLKGTAGAYGTGFGGGAGGLVGDVRDILDTVHPLPFGLTSLQNSIPKDTIKNTPQLTQGIQEQFGVQEPQNALERIAQQGGQFGGQEALVGTGLGGPAGAGIGAAHGTASGFLYGGLKELGVPDTAALSITAVATLSPIAARKLLEKYTSSKAAKNALKEAFPSEQKTADSKGSKLIEPSEVLPSKEKSALQIKPNSSTSSSFPEFQTDRLPSGLTKPRALQPAPLSQLATISKERQKISIRNLDQEASQLAQKSVQKNLPVITQIQQGVDLDSKFSQDFSRLSKLAENARTGIGHNSEPITIDITPLSDLFIKSSEKYRGIPSPHSEARKILREIERFQNNPQTELNNLLRIYRSNNRKKQGIYEKAKLLGSQREYVEFLDDMNRAIAKSFSNTLPENSIWNKEFQELNRSYAQYQRGKEALRLLDPLLRGRLTAGKIDKLAFDPQLRRRLALSLGEKGSSEIVQIAKDLKSATEAIKSIPIQKLKAFDNIYPLGLLVPFIKIPVALKIAERIGRNAYGWYLSTPGKTRALDKALNSIKEGNLVEYKKSTDELKKPLQIENKT